MTSAEVERRRLLFALAGSLFGHAVALITVPVMVTGRYAVDGRMLQVVAMSGRQVPAARAAEKMPVTAHRDAERLADMRREAAVRRPTPRKWPPDRGVGRGQADVPSAAIATERSAVVPVVSAAMSGEVHEGVNPDDLRHYRVALAVAARGFKNYPESAREQGWQGRVEIAVGFGAGRPLPRSSLARSSGHPALDERALWMIEQASATTPLPEGLKGRDFRFLLPIEFSLETNH